jgi:hypothetical protein
MPNVIGTDDHNNDESFQSDIQENYNNAYSNSRKNSLKLLKAFLEKFTNMTGLPSLKGEGSPDEMEDSDMDEEDDSGKGPVKKKLTSPNPY